MATVTRNLNDSTVVEIEGGEQTSKYINPNTSGVVTLRTVNKVQSSSDFSPNKNERLIDWGFIVNAPGIATEEEDGFASKEMVAKVNELSRLSIVGSALTVKGVKGDQGEVGPQGPKGDKGDPFTFDDLTLSQIALIRGPQGEQGEVGPRGFKGERGEPGAALTFDDLTDDQIEMLRGPKGDPGKSITFEDLTEDQKEELRGEKGDRGYPGPTGPKGERGKAFTYEDFTSSQLAELKGEKGNTGPKGENGEKGQRGESAYETAVRRGFVGDEDEWLDSLKGKDSLESNSFFKAPVNSVNVIGASLLNDKSELPTEFSFGDLYIDLTTNMLYEADIESWGDAFEPTEGFRYASSEGKIYRYNKDVGFMEEKLQHGSMFLCLTDFCLYAYNMEKKKIKNIIPNQN